VPKAVTESPPQPRGEFRRSRRHIDYRRVFSETVYALEGVGIGAGLVDLEPIPQDERDKWAGEIDEAMRPLRRLVRNLREPERTARRSCARCGKPFVARRSDARYCSVTCRVAAHRARSDEGAPR